MATTSTVKGPGSAGAARRSTEMDRERFRESFDRIAANIATVIKGKEEVIRMLLIAVLSEGHILLEDLPGTGKTMLARSLSRTINCTDSRVQCTPDLLPSDVTGAPILDLRTHEFTFRAGPVFANILLVDEINRATPKTQSALLEAMQERAVTVDGITHPLPRPFIMIATQNPIELAGTFPLPEAQLDRFMFKLSMGYPGRDAEVAVLDTNSRSQSIGGIQAVMESAEVIELMEWAKGVTVSDAIKYYIVDLVAATRTDASLMIGASSRASIGILHAARLVAASSGREDVYPDDVKHVVYPSLAHRCILTPDASLRDETVEKVLERIVNRVKPPVGPGSPVT